MKTPTFLSGQWTHLFVEDGKTVERLCDIVFDVEANKIVDMNVMRSSRWEASTEIERDDVTDSIVNANPEAIDDPDVWDLVSCDERPALEAVGWPMVA